MYVSENTSISRNDIRVKSEVDLLIYASRVRKPLRESSDRMTRLANDPYVVDCLLSASRKIVEKHTASGVAKITGQHLDLADMIRKNIPKATFRSKWQGVGFKTNGVRKLVRRKDAWFLSSDASTLGIMLELMQVRPVTYELLPVVGHYLRNRTLNFIYRTPEMASWLNEVENSQGTMYTQLPTSMLMINADNREVRRVFSGSLQRATSGLLHGIRQYGLSYRSTINDSLVGYSGQWQANKVAALTFYTDDYRRMYGTDDNPNNELWPMWYARAMLTRNADQIHELGWIMFEHYRDQPEWLEQAGLWQLFAKRRATYINRRGQRNWDDKDRTYKKIFEEADRARVQGTQKIVGGCIPETGWEPAEGDLGGGDEHEGRQVALGEDHDLAEDDQA